MRLSGCQPPHLTRPPICQGGTFDKGFWLSRSYIWQGHLTVKNPVFDKAFWVSRSYIWQDLANRQGYINKGKQTYSKRFSHLSIVRVIMRERFCVRELRIILSKCSRGLLVRWERWSLRNCTSLHPNNLLFDFQAHVTQLKRWYLLTALHFKLTTLLQHFQGMLVRWERWSLRNCTSL